MKIWTFAGILKNLSTNCPSSCDELMKPVLRLTFRLISDVHPVILNYLLLLIKFWYFVGEQASRST